MQRYDSYKDSGIQWLGQIPGHWEIKRLATQFTGKVEVNTDFKYKRAFKFNYGELVPKNEVGTDDEYKDTYIKYSILQSGDIVLNGLNLNYDFVSQRVAKCREAGIITSAYVVCRPRNEIYSDYFCLLFKGMDAKKLFHGLGTGIRLTLSYEDLKKQMLPIPPLAEQKAIVTYLDRETEKIDSFISSKEKEIRLLDELKQAEIANAVTKGLHPDVTLKDSGIAWLGQVPEHWEIKRLSTQFIGKVEANSDYQYKRAFKFNYGSLVPKEETGTEEEYRDTYIKYSVLNKGDIVINGLNLNYDFVSQRVALCEKDGIITSAYVVCRPRQDVFSEYFCYLFKGMDAQKLFHGMGTGIRLTLSFEELKKQMLPVPPLDEQHEIVDYINHRCETINTLTTELESEITQLKEYKQRLIADAVTGQIKVC